MNRTCAVVGCIRPTNCRGWCRGHYQRWLRDGDPGPAQFARPGSVVRSTDGRVGRKSPIERILTRLPIGEPGQCWVWPGAINKGYGVVRKPDGGGNCLVHRVVYEHLVGPIPPGLVIDHLCRNRACANPSHMEPVTNRVNILRGEGITAIAAARNECANGHPYTEESTYRNRGHRHCRICRRKAAS